MHIDNFIIRNQKWVRKATKLLRDAGCTYTVVHSPITEFYANYTIVFGDNRVTPTDDFGLLEIRKLIARLTVNGRRHT